jgi:copper chaperone CopZ
MFLASIYHFSFIDKVECLLAEMSKIKAQMKEAEVDEVEAKLKQQMKNVEVDEIEAKLKHRRETKREAFRATLQKVTFFYLIFVHIFNISNIIFYIGLNLISDVVHLSADDKNG